MSSSVHLLSMTSSTSEMWQALIAAPASLSVQTSSSSNSLISSSSRFSYTRDIQSGVSFWSPGRYWILKLYLRVRSLKRYSLGLVMSAMSLLFMMGTRGSWSVVTRRFRHPRVNILALSNDQTTPKASPSIGAYLDSAPEHLLLPANTILKPSLQHLGALARSQSQYFWETSIPLPDLLQSLETHLIFSSDWSKSGIGMLVSQKYCECPC